MGLSEKVKINQVPCDSGKIQQDLPKSLNWFDLVGNISFDALAIHERGEILEANQDFLDMFGYTLQEARKTSAFDMFAPRSCKSARENITSGYEGAYQAYGKKKDGTIFPIQIRAKQAFFKNRHVRVVTLRDLTLQRQQQEQFKAVLESSQDHIIVLDKNYTHLYINQPALNNVNKTPDQAGIGKTIADALGDMPDLMHLWMSRVDEVFKTQKPMRVEDSGTINGRMVYS